jgi:polyhydroxyalkanoate synthesis regulator phasin
MTTEAAPRSLAELLLAGVGWAAEGVDTVDALADDLARRLGIEQEKMRTAVRETLGTMRNELTHLGERRDDAVEAALSKTGLARREDLDELALRVAQLEHRLRLVEGGTSK